MDLDELKSTWNNLNQRIENKQRLTPSSIEQMTQKNYRSKINKIAYPEILGIIISVTSAAFIGFNFTKLDTAFLQGVGVAAIFLLLAISTISLLSLRQVRSTGDVSKPHAETLKLFASRKLRFLRWQKINVLLCYLLLVAVIILMSKLFAGRDLSESNYFWLFSFTLGYIFLLFYAKGVTRYYSHTLRQAEDLLKQLQPE